MNVKRDMQGLAGVRNAGAFLAAITCAAVLGVAPARVAADPAGAQTIDSDPIRCWWKSDKTAVQVAERFVVTLTCGVIETRRVTVVPDLDQLDAGALQLAPFEVLHGVRHGDIAAGLWRYFQYDYTVRFIDDNFFRADAEIPALPLTYTIQAEAGAVAQQGRELTYVLPPLPMRIHSVVPKGAKDIRDAPRTSFADIDARALRATWERALAVVSFAFAAVLLGAALVRAAGRWRERAPVAERVPSSFAVLGACLAELEALSAAEVATPASLARALAALRVAGAVAVSAPVTHARGDTPPRAGQLGMRSGWLKRKSTLVSAAVTARTLARALEQAPIPAVRRPAAEELRDVLAMLTAVSYGRDAKYEAHVLIRALQRAAEAVRHLRILTLWPRRSSGIAASRAPPFKDVAWSR